MRPVQGRVHDCETERQQRFLWMHGIRQNFRNQLPEHTADLFAYSIKLINFSQSVAQDILQKIKEKGLETKFITLKAITSTLKDIGCKWRIYGNAVEFYLTPLE